MYVKAVELKNVKGFEHLHFKFDRSDGSYAGWTVLVGGNASGKSTLLKAIALSLLGPHDAPHLIGPIPYWIRRGHSSSQARVTLVWAKGEDDWKKLGQRPEEFTIGFDCKTSDSPHSLQKPLSFSLTGYSKPPTAGERGPWNQQTSGWFCMGYGPMRRLSSRSDIPSVLRLGGETATSRYLTLFREDAALSQSEEWLRWMPPRLLESHDAEQQELLDGVKKLLSDDLLPHAMKISRITVDAVFVKEQSGVELPMNEISDGCRSVYALILDLVHGMAQVYGINGLFASDGDRIVVDRPGVVLIDEVEAHLHPSWQRKLPDWLKSHFPKVQFIVTTHSPLIAQSVDQRSLFVLPMQDDLQRKPRQLSATETERIRMGRAEKTLLGSAFGLSTSRTAWANQQIREWQKLDAKMRAKQKLTPTEAKLHSAMQELLEFDADMSEGNE